MNNATSVRSVLEDLNEKLGHFYFSKKKPQTLFRVLMLGCSLLLLKQQTECHYICVSDMNFVINV